VNSHNIASHQSLTATLRKGTPMDIREHLDVDEASRLAVTATAVDLEHWARSAAVHGQVGLQDLVGVLDALRAASVPQHSASAFPTLAAS
jgi:hypothetical protein